MLPSSNPCEEHGTLVLWVGVIQEELIYAGRCFRDSMVSPACLIFVNVSAQFVVRLHSSGCFVLISWVRWLTSVLWR